MGEKLNVPMDEIGRILKQARSAAIKYYYLTGKPLGITGEIGEYECARLLNLELSQARQAGFDATDSEGMKYQIKSRCIPEGGKKNSQRMGSIRLDHDWDVVLLILMDEEFSPTEIHQANRPIVKKAIQEPGSKARNKRGALSVNKFKSIGKQVWPHSK